MIIHPPENCLTKENLSLEKATQADCLKKLLVFSSRGATSCHRLSKTDIKNLHLFTDGTWSYPKNIAKLSLTELLYT
jgi:hypothetical protein